MLSCGSSVNAPLPVCEEDEEAAEEVEEEGRVLQGMTDYLLPRIGEYVESLDLAYSGSLTNTMVNYLHVVHAILLKLIFTLHYHKSGNFCVTKFLCDKFLF